MCKQKKNKRKLIIIIMILAIITLEHISLVYFISSNSVLHEYVFIQNLSVMNISTQLMSAKCNTLTFHSLLKLEHCKNIQNT